MGSTRNRRSISMAMINELKRSFHRKLNLSIQELREFLVLLKDGSITCIQNRALNCDNLATATYVHGLNTCFGLADLKTVGQSC